MSANYQYNPGPLGVGGVGGSGTRLVASLLEAMGLFMGEHVNRSNDSLVWPPFRKLLAESPGRDAAARERVVFEAITRFEQHMHEDYHRVARGDHNWFWKVPTTFFWLEPLAAYFPRMKYIHVIRHGLDMAFSGNRRQVKVWAGAVGLELRPPIDPRQMLEYWVLANDLALDRARRLLGDRCLLLSFDRLCRSPETELPRLAAFVDCPEAQWGLERWRSMIRTPESIGRFRDHDCHALFPPRLLQAVARYGYDVPSARQVS